MTRLSLGDEALYVAAGKKITLQTDFNQDATNKTLTWKITKGSAYATISSKGVLTAKKSSVPRTVTVTAYYNALSGNGKLKRNIPHRLVRDSLFHRIVSAYKFSVYASFLPNSERISSLLWSVAQVMFQGLVNSSSFLPLRS